MFLTKKVISKYPQRDYCFILSPEEKVTSWSTNLFSSYCILILLVAVWSIAQWVFADQVSPGAFSKHPSHLQQWQASAFKLFLSLCLAVLWARNKASVVQLFYDAFPNLAVMGGEGGGHCIRHLLNQCARPDWSRSWCLAALIGPMRSIIGDPSFSSAEAHLLCLKWQ